MRYPDKAVPRADPTGRFFNRVDYYVKYRPGYPTQVIELLISRCDLIPSSVVADVGSGTGLLSKLFLDNGNRVYAIEPNPDMHSFENRQTFDYGGVKGRLLSSSYAPLAGSPDHEPMLDALRAAFDAHQQDGQVAFLYTTQVFIGQMNRQ